MAGGGTFAPVVGLLCLPYAPGRRNVDQSGNLLLGPAHHMFARHCACVSREPQLENIYRSSRIHCVSGL
jgi:hypothetical protein